MIWCGSSEKKTPLNLSLFSKLIGSETVLDRQAFPALSKERINRLDVAAAIEDVIHFIRDQEAVKRTWSKEFFNHFMEDIRTVS